MHSLPLSSPKPTFPSAGGDLYEELKRVGGRFKERDTAARVLGPCLQVLFASRFAAWIKISRSQDLKISRSQRHQQHHEAGFLAQHCPNSFVSSHVLMESLQGPEKTARSASVQVTLVSVA